MEVIKLPLNPEFFDVGVVTVVYSFRSDWMFLSVMDL